MATETQTRIFNHINTLPENELITYLLLIFNKLPEQVIINVLAAYANPDRLYRINFELSDLLMIDKDKNVEFYEKEGKAK